MPKVEAAPETKTLVVTIDEGPLDVDALSKIVSIPKLKEVVNVTVNTGTVIYSVNGDNVNINANGGLPSRTVWNATKYSKPASDKRQTAAGGSPDALPTTIDYSEDGYSGSLSKEGSAMVISGEYIPPEVKNITNYKHELGRCKLSSTLECPLPTSRSAPRTVYYNVDGFSGYLTRVGEEWDVYYGNTKSGYCSYCSVPPSSSYHDYHEAYAYYSGTVTKPGIDTRVWEQNYSGTIYKGDYDKYYSYTVTIEYIDNSNPEIIINQPTPNSPLQNRQAFTKGVV